MVPARIRVETRPRSLAVPASWPRCSISCTVRCESCDQRETLAEAGINYVLSGHGLSNGHHCRICGRVRPNEQFPGKGHKIHVCKRCQRVPKSERRTVEDRDDIFGFMHQSHISKKNVARLEQLAKSETPQVASLAAIVLEVARVTPCKCRRVRILARNHRDLLRRLGETGLVFAHTWDRLPPEVLAQMHLEETEVSVKEDKAKLLAPEISRIMPCPLQKTQQPEQPSNLSWCLD